MKLTRQRLQQIIAEELQRISEEPEGSQAAPQAAPPEEADAIKGKSQIVKYLKTQYASKIPTAKISSGEADEFVDMLELVLTIFDAKSVTDQQVKRMTKLMSQAASVKV